MEYFSLKRSTAADRSQSNISSKVYVRSTKSGKVQKIVRELYLRQDIPCSSNLCRACLEIAPTDYSKKVAPFVLSDTPAGSKDFPNGQYLVPDTNAILTGMDLFEVGTAFHDVIVLQTVLEEVKNRSLPLYHRLISLTKNEGKRFYVFFNEFRQETYVPRDAGETINDRNDRAVRKAVQWYNQHITEAVAGRSKKQQRIPTVVMITDDKENLHKAKSEHVPGKTLSDFVSGLENADELLDMISAAQEQREVRSKKAEVFYADHYSVSKMMTGVKAGTLHQGIFNVSPYNYLEGSVHVPAFDKSLLVLGRENSNRAVSGDVVVVEVLPKDQWKAPSTKIIEEETMNKNDNAEAEEGENVISERERRALQEEVKRTHGQSIEGRPQPTARVVGIIKRNWRQYVGHIDRDSVRSVSKSSRQQQTVFLVPMDKRIPKIRIRTRQAGELLGQRILATIDSWDIDSRYPVGHFVRSLGELESKGAETEALLLEWDVQYKPFPKTVLDCLPAEGHDWKVPTSLEDPGWKGRKDLRDLLVCSIDPVGCVDIDDALHAHKLPNGNYQVGVHIADVSHFVKPNNAMDKEASQRGTTVYLVDKRIDMLPMLLGTDLCSLKPYVERYAFSVIWEVTEDAEIVSSQFTKSVIRSREAFSYEQAQIRIDDKSQEDDLTNGMRTLLMLSKKLKQKRMEAGALNLSSPEVKVQTESETSDPVDVQTKKLLDTNSLVEEFMLLANISVAAKNYEAFPQTALLRRHAAPPKTNFEELDNQLKVKKGMELKTDSSKALADSLDKCVDPNNPFFNTLVRIMATRCMMSAEYFCAGTQAYPEFRHYGLASEIYTHFTSPIRRYADLEAHRQLAAAIEYEQLDPSLQSKSKLEAVCKNINVRHRNAQMAGRASIEYYVGQALKGKDVQEEGFIMKIFSNGFVVFVPRFGIESLIRLRDLATPEPEADFDADNYVLNVKGDVKRNIELFEKVTVRITDELEESTGKRKPIDHAFTMHLPATSPYQNLTPTASLCICTPLALPTQTPVPLNVPSLEPHHSVTIAQCIFTAPGFPTAPELLAMQPRTTQANVLAYT
ncbi:similar to exosome complex exonuclease exoribonuclease (Rrp44) [Plenodomus lingam JN3]|uniref:Chromosome disjunction protein 3 n=1 Tax=Leptosphaeria maculans (strain JN3 / isolate v23.1.3 / race Av1-4-5-6-7-8) TaxID=985895 RepID=E4ZMZ0_LEPMJ|nr:similar to exosome complex exonuclease exoribonuclease (Rrp44) [Plenodomus lingam JN3]CBX92593.1 similar to exosome complex exonuclease exoribonuclease (Rrp44) [Plenodomus lingam JN3]